MSAATGLSKEQIKARVSRKEIRKFTALMGGLVLVTASITASPSTVTAASDTFAVVEFASALTLEEGAGLVLGYGTHIRQLVYEIPGPTPRWSGGFFPVDQRSGQTVAAEMRESQRATQADLIANADALTGKLGDSPARALYRASLATLVSGLDGNTLIRAEVTGSAQQVAGLRNDKRVKSMHLVTKAQQHGVVASRPNGLAALQPAQSPDYWAPDDNYVNVQPSNVGGGRYVQQDYIFNAGRTINMTDGGGLEMKYHQNNYDGATYFSRSEDGVRVPIVQTWSSNIPCAYLDTRVGNPVEEPAWTIGSNGDGGCWNAWSAGVWYDNYVRAYAGDASFDSSKAFPTHEQCSHQFGTCDTWSMFQDIGCNQGFWNQSIPMLNWHWNRFTGGDGGQPPC